MSHGCRLFTPREPIGCRTRTHDLPPGAYTFLCNHACSREYPRDCMALRGIPRYNWCQTLHPVGIPVMACAARRLAGPADIPSTFLSWYSMENPRDFRRQPKGLHDADIGQWYVIISITSQRCRVGPKDVSITGLGRWLAVGPAGFHGNHRHHPWGFPRVPPGYCRTVGARGDFRGNGGCPSGFRPMLVGYRG